MRSYLTLAGVAAIVLTTSVGGAFAAPHGDHFGGRDHHGRFDANSASGPGDDGIMPLASVPFPVEPAAYKPRLATILGELRTDNRRIDAEHARGHLSRVEFNRLKAREAQIRSEAMAAASRDGGMIPTGRYLALQQQVHQLSRSI